MPTSRSRTTLPGDAAARALSHVAALSEGPALDRTLRVTLNFHPDKPQDGIPLLQALLEDGVYRSQFETGSSNGGLSAFPGGALDYRRSASGASPRFGSAHLGLRADVLQRCTFCYPDSVFEPAHFGTAQRMGLIDRALADDKDALDDYIEAHVHGPLRLNEHVEALVLDPCYRGTVIESLGERFPCAVEWHPGFRLAVETLQRHPAYRGQEYVDLGARIADGGWLDPACIGRAAWSGRYDEQSLKKVWHHLARFGDLSRTALPSAS
jgi:hypothetical protein